MNNVHLTLRLALFLQEPAPPFRIQNRFLYADLNPPNLNVPHFDIEDGTYSLFFIFNPSKRLY
jgi:hypothetical protein